MKVPFLAFLAMLCFTAYNLIISHKLSKFSPLVGVAYVHLLPTLAAILIVFWQRRVSAQLALPA
ncbi:MAG: hypothetical protein Q8R32_01890, partial [bacterium]|nr:hypothetical protein [bacterium]